MGMSLGRLPLGAMVVMAALLAVAVAGGSVGRAQAPQPAYTVGAQQVIGATWNFDGDLAAGLVTWATLTVQNVGCDTPPPTPESAGAGAGVLVWTAQLILGPGGAAAIYQGDLVNTRGGGAGQGHVRVVTPPTGPGAVTHVDVYMWDLGGEAQGNLFQVCLSPSTP